MPVNRLLPWQYDKWSLLRQYIQQNRIPHALLISGATGIGKQGLATQFAYSLLCTNIGSDGFCCRNCRSCRLIESNTHPDFFEINPNEGKTTIAVEQVRKLIAETYLKPQFDAYRVIIINPADSMTLSAANAFLKCLEEPTDRTVFILLTARANKIPATIASRCQKIDITYPKPEVLIPWMQKQGIDKNQDTLIKLLQASAIKSDQLTDKLILQQRIHCFDDWLALAKGNAYPGIISEKWKLIPETELLNWVISWVSDLIKCVYKIDRKGLCNLDFISQLQSLSKRLEIKGLFTLYSLLLNARQQIGSPLNFQIMLEEILVQWARLNGWN